MERPGYGLTGRPPPVPQCRELYYCVKDSMERAAARQQSIKPGEEGVAPRRLRASGLAPLR